MSNYGPRKPLHVQNPDLVKATGAQSNPSWESFRAHRTFKPEYKTQPKERPSTHAMSLIRRNPNGELDYEWARSIIIEAINGLSYPHALTPLHQALVTIMYPEKIRMMEPAIAELRTQLSGSEKTKLRSLIKDDLIEMENWNAGSGGGNPVKPHGVTKTRAGYP